MIKNLFRYWTYQIFSPGTVLREKYEAFKKLLAHDKAAHEHLAVLEDFYYNQKRYDFQAVVKTYEHYSRAVSGMVDALLTMCPSDYWNLRAYFKKFDFYVRFMLAPPMFDISPPFTVAFEHANAFDETMVGKKALTLSLVEKTLHLPTPRGFVITTHAFHYFLKYNNLQSTINKKLAMLDINDAICLEHTSDEIRNLILNGSIPHEIHISMANAMETLQQNRENEIKIALRSSAVKEDGLASFAGQYRTLLDVNPKEISEGYKTVLAGKYSPQALFYRISNGILDSETPMAVLVLEMIDAMASGVMYTRDIELPASDNLVIHSVGGQGEILVDGGISPDVIHISRKNPNIISSVNFGEKQKQVRLIRNVRIHPQNQPRPMKPHKHQGNLLSMDAPHLLTLARWGVSLETHFNHPQDVEWCLDKSGNLFILQSRPLHLHSTGRQNRKPPHPSIEIKKDQNSILCSGGQMVCPGLASGPVYRLDQSSRLEDMPRGAVLVVRHGRPQFVTAIDNMAAVIIGSGSSASHFSSIVREFGVPTIVNVTYGFHDLIHGQWVTVDADNGMVYHGVPLHSRTPGKSAPKNETVFKESSFMLKLRYVIDFSAKLKLTDPKAKNFMPEGCRSLHDIVRFVHETAVQEMFLMGKRKGRSAKGAKKLISPIPMLFYILDVGQGIKENSSETDALGPDDIASLPMKWVLKGLVSPGINWSEATHFDWETHDKIVMSGGIISADSPRFGSYAVVSKAYANINFRFGYHFVILDALCTPLSEDNYILFRFSGGGGDPTGRKLRAAFIEGILTRLGFMVTVKSDLVDGEFRHGTLSTMKKTLEIIGKLLGASKLMDMYLKEEQEMTVMVDEFMAGRYDFRNHR